MEDDFNKFMRNLFLLIAGIALCITAYGMYKTNKMTQLIESGQDPIRVACAFGDSRTEPMCILIQR